MAFEDFTKLAQSIVQQRCAVIIGAGVSAPLLPSAGELAAELERGLPQDHPNRSDGLSSVAQALSTLNQPLWVKTQLQHYLRARLERIDYSSEVWQTYQLIAALPVSVFITTNYDDLLLRALRAHPKAPRAMVAPWMDFGLDATVPIAIKEAATEVTPLVLHLHGHLDHPETLVLTEDDYIQFLFAMAQDVDKSDRQKRVSLMPMAAKKALSSQNLLMLGYRAADINFRLLVKSAEALLNTPRNLPGGSARVRVSVQLKPERGGDDLSAMRYIEGQYEQSLSFKLFWGSALEFLRHLQPAISNAQESFRRSAPSSPIGGLNP